MCLDWKALFDSSLNGTARSAHLSGHVTRSPRESLSSSRPSAESTGAEPIEPWTSWPSRNQNQHGPVLRDTARARRTSVFRVSSRGASNLSAFCLGAQLNPLATGRPQSHSSGPVALFLRRPKLTCAPTHRAPCAAHLTPVVRRIWHKVGTCVSVSARPEM